MIDSHTHIHDAKFCDDLDAVMKRAQEVGVRYMVAVGTNVDDSRSAVAMAKRFSNTIVASVAVHPHEYSTIPSEATRHEWLSQLEILANEPKVVAIGECGLEYHSFDGGIVSSEVKSAQQEGFRDQLRLAVRVGKSVIVHARESYEDVATILQEELQQEKTTVILHCYQGNSKETQKFLTNFERVFFSFAGNVTYPVRSSIRGTKDDPKNIVAMIPIERLLIETDCPYLSPQSRRGERNEPAFIIDTAVEIAQIKNMSLKDMKKILENTFDRAFALS